MTCLSAHLGYLFTELPLTERLAAASRAGFTAIEHPEPWAIPAPEMRARLGDLGLGFIQVTSGMGGGDEKGLAALPGREAAFREGFARALDYAAEVGAGFIHPMAGIPRAAGADTTYRANLDWALERLDGYRQRLLLEAITLPGYHLASLDAALALQAALDGKPLLLLDSFHAHRLGENPALWAARHGPRIGHVHIADHPGRHEPGSGTLDFPALLAALRASGYAGALGFEYIPTTTTTDSLRFLPGWRDLLQPRPDTGHRP